MGSFLSGLAGSFGINSGDDAGKLLGNALSSSLKGSSSSSQAQPGVINVRPNQSNTFFTMPVMIGFGLAALAAFYFIFRKH